MPKNENPESPESTSLDIDLTAIEEEDLIDLLNDVLAERERRINLAEIPSKIADLRQKYIDGGGDPVDLA